MQQATQQHSGSAQLLLWTTNSRPRHISLTSCQRTLPKHVRRQPRRQRHTIFCGPCQEARHSDLPVPFDDFRKFFRFADDASIALDRQAGVDNRYVLKYLQELRLRSLPFGFQEDVEACYDALVVVQRQRLNLTQAHRLRILLLFAASAVCCACVGLVHAMCSQFAVRSSARKERRHLKNNALPHSNAVRNTTKTR